MGSVRWGHVGRQAGFLLLWSYVLLAAGGLTGLLNVRLRAFSLALGALVVGGWLLAALLRRERVWAGGLGWGWLALLAGQTAALGTSADPRRGLPYLAMWLAYLLIFMMLLAWLRREGSAALIEDMFLVAGGILIGFALLDLVQNYLYWRALVQGLEHAPPFVYRLYSVVGDANLLAAAVNFLIVLAAARLLRARGRLARLALAVYLLAALTVEWYADSRGGLIGLAAALGALGAVWVWPSLRGWRPSRADLRRTWFVLPVLAGLVALALWLGPRVLRLGGDATHGPAASARSVFWGAAGQAFRADPWTGMGPGMYPAALAAYSSTPPDRPYLHAHSWPVTVAAESGLLGLAGLAAFALNLAWLAWRRLKRGDSDLRLHWAAALAALAGFTVHSQADYFMVFPAAALPALFFLAVLVHESGAENEPRRAGHPVWALLAGLLLLAYGVYDLRGISLSERGVSAAEAGDWASAAEWMRQAAAADPRLALYPLNAGYALARDGETAAAIAYFEAGIAREPAYALNYANLAALYLEMGDPQRARLLMEQAADAAPAAPEFQYWLSLYRRATEDEIRAMEAYERYEDLAKGTPRTRTLNGHLAAARAAIAAGDLAGAEVELLAAQDFYSPSPIVYLGFAELEQARGDLEAARRTLQLGLWLQGTSNADKVEPLLLLANIELEDSDEEAALAAFRAGYLAVSRHTVNGWGSQGWTPYPWVFFLRAGFAEDVLPALPRQPLPAGWLALLKPYPALLEAHGDPAAAAEIRAFLERARLSP
jgi:tetratricopeptide (TPR) repeat protein